jgi:hypothetical protein
MELPVVQYKRHRVAYTVVAILLGLIPLGMGCYGLIKEGSSSIWSWILFVVGLIIFTRCGWLAITHSLVMELNSEGIQYKEYFFSWNTLNSYGIRDEVGEGGSFTYLVLRFKDGKDPAEIQLDWMEDHESVPEKMAVYASAFQIVFDGVVRKEI